MLNCRQVTRLVSQSMDGRLRWYQQLGVRLHLLYCVWCRRYVAQLRFLRKASKQQASETETAPYYKLSDEAKTSIRSRLQEVSKDNPPASK